jgi:hypothetical protein
MSYTQDVQESDIYTVLRSFIMSVLGSAVTEVIRIPTNRVPMPKTYPFVTMSPVMKQQLEWPSVVASDPSTQPQSNAITQAVRYQIQVDAYGPTSGDLIQTLWGVLQAPDAFDFFAAQTIKGVYPLYADNPRQHALVDEEDEFEVRWMMDVSLQFNPTLTSAVQTASTATVSIVNVEAAYQ